MGIAWANVEDALRSWVMATSGLGAGQVIFHSQKGPRPSGQFIAIELGDLVPVGRDAITRDYDAGRDPGEEIANRATGLRELGVTIHAIGGGTVGDGTVRQLTSQVVTGVRAPTSRDALRAVGLAPYHQGAVRWVPAVLDTVFEGRAVAEVRFYTSEEYVEYGTYIETVEGTGTVTSPTEIYTVPLEVG